MPTYRGKNGNDALIGSNKADYMYGFGGNDELWGRAGNDALYGGVGDDWLYGEAGDDTLYGEDGEDHLYGGDGSDVLRGGNGNDPLLAGGDGRDSVRGDAGNDRLEGGAGDDELYGGPGADVLVGGEGADAFFWMSLADWDPVAGTDTIEDYNPAEDKLWIGGPVPDANLQLAGNQDWQFVGAAPTGTHLDNGNGQATVQYIDGYTVLTLYNNDGDFNADFSVRLAGTVDQPQIYAWVDGSPSGSFSDPIILYPSDSPATAAEAPGEDGSTATVSATSLVAQSIDIPEAKTLEGERSDSAGVAGASQAANKLADVLADALGEQHELDALLSSLPESSLADVLGHVGRDVGGPSGMAELSQDGGKPHLDAFVFHLDAPPVA
jgi:hypothetical protein